MKNLTIKKLLKAKKVHVSIAKKNLAIAHGELAKIKKLIEMLEIELFEMKKGKIVKQEKALKKALAENFNPVSHTRVCNVYKLVDEEILLQNKKIVQQQRREKDALDNIVKAQEKLTKSMQKEEKIAHVVDTIVREQMVRDEIIGETL